ncbi:replication protein RepA [Pseudomonas akapageensis]|uniref:replication protein RepA n=1 Tax=Pseudomonas akapageensis TaxID=2609961 RepID=UPI001C49933C|nr:replication protein RepA [Pseudomonas akapageensis]
MSIQAGYLDEGGGPVLQEIPYGAMPRLALTWISTYAVRHKTNRIPIGDTAADFLKLLELDTQGTRYDKLHQAINALATCRIHFGLNDREVDGTLISQFDAWQPLPDNRRRRWPGLLTLDDQFYKSLQKSAVPLDKRALWALKGSSLALDIYTWLAQRLHHVPSNGTKISWKPIRTQFAGEYVGKNASKDFKKEFVPALDQVKTVYPGAKVAVVRGGLLLQTSDPPIPFKPMDDDSESTA